MTVTIFNTHSYSNRRIVAFDTLLDYTIYFGQLGKSFYNIDFKMNDGITSNQILNLDSTSDPDYAHGLTSANYLIVSEQGEVVSRWWVVESKLTRFGQVSLSLLRDVVADNIDKILEAPAFIEKGWISSPNDPGIFNNESLTFNQIKQLEQPLIDKSNSAWYVAYLSKDFGKDKETGEYQEQTITISKQVVSTSGAFESDADYEWSQYTESNPLVGDYEHFAVELYGYSNQGASEGMSFIYAWDGNGKAVTPYPHDNYRVYGIMSKVGVLVNPEGGAVGIEQQNALVDLPSIYAHTSGDWITDSRSYTGVKTNLLVSDLLAQNNRLIRVDGVAKRVVVKQKKTTTKTFTLMASEPYGQRIWNVAVQSGQFKTNQVYVNLKQTITYRAPEYYVELEIVDEPEYTFTIPANRQHTRNVPYDILAIPYNEIYIDTEATKTSAALSKDLVTALQLGVAAEYLYDVQLVPYCPLADSWLDEYAGILTTLLNNTTELSNYSKVQPSENSGYSLIIYASDAEFEKRLSYSINVPSDPLEFKVTNECDMWRLCSPNYNGQFEFSAAKNNGVKAFNIAFTYKPYSPYIRVAPLFDRLYGSDFSDARGLICGGDFSISQTNEAWKSYEVQNKNYQTIFDRQILNMERNNSVQRIKERVNVAAGAVGGIASGATAGGLAGGGVGMAIGGVAGGVASLAGGIADVVLNERLRDEALSYERDQFGYQLQNIQALPYSLTKVGSQNTDFKVFPFLEYYTCTETEKEALRDKCKWNGMTIERIGTINSFLNPDEQDTWIQAKLIRLEIGEDSHVNDVINTELRTGVYFV